ncbi:hypothetical protein GCM10010289_57250 [Streptomyces violascens]|uniref:Uncharacterized protein n=1 Tax=Streptomyces violascens TaxID=67381 RepID=A0ABQ3QW06_9ACTN|nr:hypothetical protein GCM10010289_57250 [Streptomyces violascens]GHI41469.1 hypothetical protein Sviol_58770 [Streptomyces violascens]
MLDVAVKLSGEPGPITQFVGDAAMAGAVARANAAVAAPHTSASFPRVLRTVNSSDFTSYGYGFGHVRP